ncbi:MAG: NAD(P)/FAD-dependent oxidoreductase [Solirubrobacterales bacterium]|nr:NAD(P)/FAD-dependent oxidoreductase [Solirubrobacterales bacterium]
MEHFDVLIVGAGLSGLGAGCHLRRSCPDRRFAILERRAATGGTWDLFRYPGIRSDSDMYTLGYSFAPLGDSRSIAEGSSILRYVRETAARYGVDREVRLGHEVTDADWDSSRAAWTVHVRLADTGERLSLRCSFLLMCSGYYRYDAGYTPELPGIERFAGPVIHPQRWPDDLHYAGRRVVVIGSGATAITLVPALAKTAGHVTMLQRSPSYVVSLPSVDGLAQLARARLPETLAYRLVRAKNVLVMVLSYQLSQRWPRMMRAVIRRAVASQLPPGVDVDTHFAPRYGPWDQRLCVAPGGDLFRALRAGDASVVTDRIAGFTERGIVLGSGETLAADVIITATGLTLQVFGGARLSVDGRRVSPGDTVAYRGMMLSGVPNLALAIGYANASWTLKADLSFVYLCRLLNHMRDRGYAVAMPPADPAVPRQPLLPLRSGYVLRAHDELPSQGTRAPWRVRQNYPLDLLDFRRAAMEDGVMEFSRAPVPSEPAPPELGAAA